MLKDKTVRKTSTSTQRALAELKVCDLWKMRQVTQEGYKHTMKLCREKIRRTKAQLDLHVATAVEDNKRLLQVHEKKETNREYMKQKEKLHPLLDMSEKQ